MDLRARIRRRLRRGKSAAVLAGKTLGVAATVGVLVVLWRMLHDAEAEWFYVEA